MATLVPSINTQTDEGPLAPPNTRIGSVAAPAQPQDATLPSPKEVRDASGTRQRIAIIGSGVAGLATYYSLKDSGHDVHLFEAQDWLGGHTNTVSWEASSGQRYPVDTGFIVINPETYPNFLNFLAEVGIEPIDTKMTFSISRDKGKFEWAGDNLATLFCQLSNLFSPSFWRMLYDFARFNATATDLLCEDNADENPITLGQYLDQHGYSQSFRHNYLLPMTACVWSTGPNKCALDFPAVTLIRFMMNHQLLNTIQERPKWKTIQGGAKRYITAIVERVHDGHIHLGRRAIKVKPTPRNYKGPQPKAFVTFQDSPDQPEAFDQVVLACHGDQAYDLISQDATRREAQIMSRFTTSMNVAYLHSDVNLAPKRRMAWSAWNYLTSSDHNNVSHPDSETVTLTYNMNILQKIDPREYGNILVTLNPPEPPRLDLTQAVIPYRHPIYTNDAVRAQRVLPEIQGARRVWFAGAWTGYGFHEDGFMSGLWVGQNLGGQVDWEVQDMRVERNRPRPKTTSELIARFIILMVLVFINSWTFAKLLLRVGLARMLNLSLNMAPQPNPALRRRRSSIRFQDTMSSESVPEAQTSSSQFRKEGKVSQRDAKVQTNMDKPGSSSQASQEIDSKETFEFSSGDSRRESEVSEASHLSYASSSTMAVQHETAEVLPPSLKHLEERFKPSRLPQITETKQSASDHEETSPSPPAELYVDAVATTS